MRAWMKKIAAGFLAWAICLMLIPVGSITSYAATGKISFSDPSATVGEQVSVTMKITSDSALGASDVMLQYDSAALEFVSGTNANGGAGSVRVVGSMESADQKTFSFTLKFKALKAGTTSITVKSQEVYDSASKAVTIEHVGSSSVKVTAESSSSKDASLSSLSISPGTLKPAFSADVTEYTATVSTDISSVTVSAPANDGNAKVSVSGNEDLQDGENTITCKVTAEDGETTKTYTILITKTDETESVDDETMEESESTDESAGLVGEDGNWTVADTFEDSDLPDGFTSTEITYEGKSVKAATDDSGLTLLYMTDDSGNGDFFVYDSEKGTLSAYVVVNMAEKSIVVLPPECIPDGTTLPDGFAECTIDIGDHTVHGWIWKDDTNTTPEYCVVYGRNENGEENFYRYDQKEMTLQRYFEDPDAASTRSKYLEVANEYNSLLKDYNIRGFLVIGLFALSIILLIVIIILLLRKPKAPKEPDMDRRSEKSAKGKAKRARQEESFDFYDDDEDEPEADTRARVRKMSAKVPARETVRTAKTAKNGEKKPSEKTPVKTSTKTKRTVERDVTELEKELSGNLAKEAAKARPKTTSKAKKLEDDDDFEFIDLDD